MTVQEFAKLKPGTRVQWRESSKSPRPGELTDRGTVVLDTVNSQHARRFIRWDDNQTTDGRDDRALRQVEQAGPPTPEAA